MINRLETKILIVSICFTMIILFYFGNLFVRDIKNQFLLFLLPLVWPGLAHGSLDLKIAKRIKLIKKKWDYLYFFFSYIFLASSLVFIWIINAEIAMSIFILVSIVHFGMSDTLIQQKKLTYFLDVFIRGSIPISISTVFFQDDVSQIFRTLFLSEAYIGLAMNVFKLNMIPMVVAVLIQIYFKKKLYFESLYEIFIISFCFLFFEPLIAFAIYFCFLHSLRHLFNEKKKLNLSLSETFIQTLPITLISFLSLCFVYSFIDFTSTAFEYITILFISLASLTIPHMVLVYIEKISKT